MQSEIARIKEMFVSTQGEGPYVGVRQLFIRFCACNLSCKYCDTDYTYENANFVYSPDELLDFLNKEFDLTHLHSISLTGGEPLLHSEFLKIFMPVLKAKYYLETNATLPDKLHDILDYVNIISADIKLPSATGLFNTFEKHDAFFGMARENKNIDLFAKVVFDETITEEEIIAATNLAKKYDFELILQPRTINNEISPSINFADELFSKCLKRYKRVRLIPQVHKFLDIR